MGSTSPSAHHVQQNTHDKLLFLKLEENNTPIDRNNWLSYLQSIIGRKLATDDDKIELHSSMETGYLEAITPVNHNCSDFHPKDNQKAVYRWYDRKYSEAAWDIYSNDWELRIFEWHQAWHAAHQTALQETNPKFNINPQLENLPLGKFFLAHPIAGFSLWRYRRSGVMARICPLRVPQGRQDRSQVAKRAGASQATKYQLPVRFQEATMGDEITEHASRPRSI